MVLAELELWHSRPIAPTRRVALGDSLLPTEPPPGLGGILLGGVLAAHLPAVDPDLVPDLNKLIGELERGQRIPQPRLRYRFQIDRIGLQRSLFRLRGNDDELWFDFEAAHAAPEQAVLGAVYAAGRLDRSSREAAMATLRRAIRWEGPAGPDLIASLAGFSKGRNFSVYTMEHPVEWALEVLGFAVATGTGGGGRGQGAGPSRPTNGARRANGVNGVNGTDRPAGAPGAGDAGPSRSEIRRRFRELLMDAHPDRGATTDGAAQRIADLTEARRILLDRPIGP